MLNSAACCLARGLWLWVPASLSLVDQVSLSGVASLCCCWEAAALLPLKARLNAAAESAKRPSKEPKGSNQSNETGGRSLHNFFKPLNSASVSASASGSSSSSGCASGSASTSGSGSGSGSGSAASTHVSPSSSLAPLVVKDGRLVGGSKRDAREEASEATALKKTRLEEGEG